MRARCAWRAAERWHRRQRASSRPLCQRSHHRPQPQGWRVSWFPTLGRAGSLGRVVGRHDLRGRGPDGFRKHTPETIRPSASSSTMQRCAVRQLIDRETTQRAVSPAASLNGLRKLPASSVSSPIRPRITCRFSARSPRWPSASITARSSGCTWAINRARVLWRVRMAGRAPSSRLRRPEAHQLAHPASTTRCGSRCWRVVTPRCYALSPDVGLGERSESSTERTRPASLVLSHVWGQITSMGGSSGGYSGAGRSAPAVLGPGFVEAAVAVNEAVVAQPGQRPVDVASVPLEHPG